MARPVAEGAAAHNRAEHDVSVCGLLARRTHGHLWMERQHPARLLPREWQAHVVAGERAQAGRHRARRHERLQARHLWRWGGTGSRLADRTTIYCQGISPSSLSIWKHILRSI